MNYITRKFEHVEKNLLGYDDLVAETSNSGRVYFTPDGIKYPSVTTVLSILTKDAINEWRARVGAEEANKVSKRASARGTKVHSIIENYLNNDPNCLDNLMPHVLNNFNSIKSYLDECIGDIYALEAPLYSHHLTLAGRVDCVAEWDGKLSIIDFKTSNRIKEKDKIENYFIQEAAYAIMWEERTGMPITQLVTLIAGDEGAQVFIEHRDNHTTKLLSTIKEYNRKSLFGN